MGTVVKEKDGRFRVRIRRKVRGVLIDKSARFERLTDARKWDQQIEAEITAGKFFKTLEAEQHTLNDVLLRYKQHLALENPRRLKTVKHLLDWWAGKLGNLKGCRDRAILLTGFCAALRRSELAGIRCEDIEINNQGIVLTLRRSKTDQFGEGRKIGIPRGRGKICPVASLEKWLEHSGLKTGPLFRAISKGMTLSVVQISDRAIANIVKDYALKAGLDPAKYSGHSLRSGLCSSAAQHGYSSWVIRKQSGHKTDAMLYRYIRIGDLFTDNAAALF